jgi:ribosomal 50S subunit-recycling heat shock protein
MLLLRLNNSPFCPSFPSCSGPCGGAQSSSEAQPEGMGLRRSRSWGWHSLVVLWVVSRVAGFHGALPRLRPSRDLCLRAVRGRYNKGGPGYGRGFGDDGFDDDDDEYVPGGRVRTFNPNAGRAAQNKAQPRVTIKRPESERLQKVIAQAGVTSRRKAEEMITGGRVTVNGVKVSELGTKVKPASDKICVDGKRVVVRTANELYWIMVNKPKGVITSFDDERDRKSVADLVPLARERRLLPVGRLDRDTAGLLLMTNDNEAINLLTHPSFGHTKTYKVRPPHL